MHTSKEQRLEFDINGGN